MHSSIKTLLPLGLLATTTFAAPTCRDVYLSVQISATNVQVPSTFSIANLLSYLELSISQLINIPIIGTYSIYGRYCEPEIVVSGHGNVLQLLVHGSARDHHYWNAYDFDGQPIGGPSNYSWIGRSSLQGYPTFAIDRLGDGLSSHPDPKTVVQLPAQVEVAHQIIQQINKGILGRTFSEVVFVGHSLGSVIGQIFSAKYPKDCSRIILTGWASVNLKQLASASSPTKDARAQEPARFGTLPPGYVESTNMTADSQLTYYGYGTNFASRFYDPQFPAKVFPNRQTTTTGEQYTVAFAITSAPQFTGRVFVATGNNDAYWCGAPTAANCGAGSSSVIAAGKNVYPAAKSYDYVSPENTGHELLSHYTAGQTYDAVFKWLNSTA